MTHHGCGLAARTTTSPDPKEETYTATRVSHPNCSRFTHRPAGLPSPLTHLWRPPAVAGAGGLHRWTAGPRTGAVDSPGAPPARLLRRPTRPSSRPACPQPLSPAGIVTIRSRAGLHPGRHSPRPGSADPRQGGPGTALPPSPAPHPPSLVASLGSPFPCLVGHPA